MLVISEEAREVKKSISFPPYLVIEVGLLIYIYLTDSSIDFRDDDLYDLSRGFRANLLGR